MTGYYLPNTTANLEILRNKFITEDYGENRMTRHIEYPGLIYDEYAVASDLAIRNAIRRILKKIEDFDENPEQVLVLTVSGWADPRVIYTDATL